ncbi:thiol peroxidase [Micrococcus sp. HG099]|uniref:Thiol peroxidase n=2 Tax=Micrococcus TaxID=1269 RepID=A0A7W9JHS9_9MICC|nr:MULTISPECIES: thiol peroxidase [Micrococcus]EZP40552.1 putative thiol peroxidase [Micrococcus luteus]MBB5847751.1 thiol peroxidase [Micrococcus endophyticus]MCR8675220.1 thiol peroxidase [Micrococcus sp. HG099]MDV7176380.1 thiol peroxidase [Micrococcus yunnanensis]QCP07712.1 thiol peroxidase [Micrococcus luteus]
MATTHMKSTPVQTVGDLPEVGAPAPDFTLTGADLSPVTLQELRGRRVILNVFPSLDTGVCAASVREFNSRATDLEDTTVLAVSADLPFAAARFCSAEGIENVRSGSVFRSSFGDDYGVTMVDGPLEGLLARAVVVVDAEGVVRHAQLVPEITEEPDYEAALAAAQA